MTKKLLLATANMALGLCFVIFWNSAVYADGGVYSNNKYGIAFDIPNGVQVYTAENPGPLRPQISLTSPIYIVNTSFTEENINVIVSEGVSSSDLMSFKKMLDDNPNMSVPQYKRVSVSSIKIGKHKNKDAVEHLFFMKGNIMGKLRQITFSHNGRWFTFTCATAVDRFDKTNKTFFDPIFTSMEFK